MKSRVYVSRIGSRGRITIPKQIRDALGLKAGDRVRFVEHQGDIILEPVKPSLRDFKGSVEPRERPEDFGRVRQEAKRRKAEGDQSERTFH